ncbi:MAG: cob(I)yrinic acid a,c-diamide adenosyltransferase [Candidatus Omnitrophica bacterium]|nr:cob(I)yrinic acid a,c-diamide adenosyltransferase [Candidatus Omnitrophota bacterium]
MIQVYTGSGKGKTTAALGLAFRALGHGKSVFLVQFMKKGTNLGEIKAAGNFKKFKIKQAGRGCWVRKGSPEAYKDRQCAQEGWAYAQKAIASKKYDVVILDELNVAVYFDLLEANEVIKSLKRAPSKVEVVITGRHAHPDILKIADLISEIKERRHYYKKGVVSRKGIEY